MAKTLKQSETKTVMRSQIQLNIRNPKLHTDGKIKEQKRNLQKVGYLGGIIYNETSRNLIDGHRRILALDNYYGYDGTPDTDYEVKVEAVNFDEKTEKEQMTYQAVGNSQVDYNLIANYIDDIDWKNSGLTEMDFQAIQDLKPITAEEFADMPTIDTLEEDFAPKVKEQPKEQVFELPKSEPSIAEIQRAHEEKPKMTREEVRGEKEHCVNQKSKYMNDVERYIIVNFNTYEEKQMFCDILGVTMRDNMIISGSELLEKLDL